MNHDYASGSLANNATRTLRDPLPVPQPVPAAVGSLTNATERLHDRLTALQQRLEGILAPLPPAGVTSGEKLARHSLALMIESEAGKVNEAAERVDLLISRLEL